MWTAKITGVSSVDSGGVVVVNFDIIVDKKILYPNMVTQGQPDTIKENITKIISDLKVNAEQAKHLSVGDTIEV